MRYAIFSDIHGNWQAWNAILADMYDSNVDVPVCLGDIVGYGPCPQRVLDGIREVTTNFVMGNHDAAASGVIDPAIFNDTARAVIEWTRGQLNKESIHFLGDMALVIEDGDLLFVHAEIEEPGRFYYIDSEAEAQDNFQYCTQRITFVGHTHDPTIFVENEDGTASRLPDTDCELDPRRRYIINVGSVGEPRNPEDIRARYVIFDTETNQVTFRRIEFDIEGYRADLAASGLSIKPYFLTVVDEYGAAVEMAAEVHGKLMRDMQTPVHAPKLLSKGTRRIVVSSRTGRPPLSRVPLPVQKTGPGPGVFITIFLVLLIGACGAFYWGKTKQGDAIAIMGESLQETSPEMASGTILDGTASVTVLNSPANRPAIPPRSADGVSLNDWNFDKAEGTLGDPPFVNYKAGEVSTPLIETVPKNGFKNPASASGGIWHSAEPNEQYAIRADRSWTFEGWFQTGPLENAEVQIIAGDRGSSGLGWQLDVREQAGQKLNFSYCPEPGYKNNRFLRVPAKELFDGKPHHFAIVWKHTPDANDAGTVTVFVDGKAREGYSADQKKSKPAPRVTIPLNLIRRMSVQAPFSIGGRLDGTDTQVFEGTLDELRFTSGALKPTDFLLAKDGVLPTPVVAAAKVEKAPPPAKPAAPPTVKSPPAAKPDYEKDLVFYAPFDEPAGAKSSEDLSGNGRHIDTISGELGKPGKVGSSVHLLKGGLKTRNVPLDAVQKLSISFWVKMDAEQVVADLPTNAIRIPVLYKASIDLDAKGNPVLGLTPAGDKVVPFPKDNNWHHVFIETKDNKTQAYIDGQKAGNPIAFPMNPKAVPGTPFEIGIPDPKSDPKNPPRARYQLDELAIWKRDLTENERTNLFELGKNGLPILEGPQEFNWKFDGNLDGTIPLSNLDKPGDSSMKPAIAPAVIPSTGSKNSSAMRISHIAAPAEDAEDFAISKTEGITYEGWFLLRPGQIATLGSTLEDIKNEFGWKLGAIPRSKEKGDLIFMVENGKDVIKFANASEQSIFDRKPHHIAGIWRPLTPAGDTGKLEIYLDGNLVASQDVLAADLPSGKPNRLEIGGKGQDLIVYEIRFMATALRPVKLLTGLAPKETATENPAEKKQ